jgi:hypothetical protein
MGQEWGSSPCPGLYRRVTEPKLRLVFWLGLVGKWSLWWKHRGDVGQHHPSHQHTGWGQDGVLRPIAVDLALVQGATVIRLVVNSRDSAEQQQFLLSGVFLLLRRHMSHMYQNLINLPSFDTIVMI